jgi:hypothetical protein
VQPTIDWNVNLDMEAINIRLFLLMYCGLHCLFLIVVMTQGLDTGLSSKPPGFDSRLNHQVFSNHYHLSEEM